jgi:uncharacterized protein
MVLCDVNVVLSAGMPESPHHRICRERLEELTDAQERFAISELVLSAVVRIATNAKVFKQPSTLASAFAFVGSLRDHPDAVAVSPGPRHWRVFQEIATAHDCRGPDTTDAYLAALAIEHGCEWWTADAGFARFRGLRWRNVLAS